MRIHHLHTENFKRVKIVDITPKDNMVVISGNNGQGKSSVMDSFMATLCGGLAMKDQPQPIRDGQDRAEVTVDLGQYKVTRVWTPGGSHVTVEGDGQTFKRPQELLDSIIGKLSFDPMEFMRMKPKEQRDTLLSVVPLEINLPLWETQRQKEYDRRTEIGRNAERLKGKLTAFPIAANLNLPDEELGMVELSGKLASAIEFNQGLAQQKVRVAKLESTVTELEQQLKEAQRDLQDAKDELRIYGNGTPKDTELIKRELSEAETTNVAIRQKKERVKAENELKEAEAAYDAQTAILKRMEGERKDALAKAKMPIPGLGFDSEGVTYNDKPLTQASSAEQTMVSMAIAMSLNPTLKVIRIMDGSLLDDQSMEMVRKLAEERDFQIWIEKVDGSGKVGIYIEEGEIIPPKA